MKRFKKRGRQEKDLKEDIKADLPAGSWNFAPVQTGMGRGGIPDIIACVPTVIKQEDVGKTFGMLVGIEAKMRGNKPSALQQEQLEGIAAAGGSALVITGQKDKKIPYRIERIKCG